MSAYYERYDRVQIMVRNELETAFRGIRPPLDTSEEVSEASQTMREHQMKCIDKQVQDLQEYLNQITYIMTTLRHPLSFHPAKLADLETLVDKNRSIAQRLRDWALGHKELNTFPTNYDELVAARELTKEGMKQSISLLRIYTRILRESSYLLNSADLTENIKILSYYSTIAFVLIEFVIDKAMLADESGIDDNVLKAWAL